jgi:predicted dehydrogenase
MPSAGSCFAFRLSGLLLMALPVIAPSIATAQPQPMPIKVAVIGLVHGHADGFLTYLPQRKNADLVGICEPDQEVAARYAKKFGLPQSLFFTRMDEMIETRHPQALLLYNATADHRKVIETVAHYGLPIMVEKPLTISLDDALAIRKVARENHIQVLVNYETMWYSSNRAAYDEVQQGRLGPVRKVVVHDGHQGPADLNLQPEFLRWLLDPARNGAGALYDFGCYGVDLMTWLMHGEAPLTVTAVANHDKPQTYPKVDDDATIVLAYPRAQAIVQGSWNWPFARKDIEVYGATGYAITVGPDKMRIRHEHDAAEQPSIADPLPPAESNAMSYLGAVVRGEVIPDGDQAALGTNVIVMQILDAARESVRTGKSVRLTKLAE